MAYGSIATPEDVVDGEDGYGVVSSIGDLKKDNDE